MICNELDFKKTVTRLIEQHLELVDQRERLRLAGLPDEQIEQLLGNLIFICQNLEDEIATYERQTNRTWVAVG